MFLELFVGLSCFLLFSCVTLDPYLYISSPRLLSYGDRSCEFQWSLIILFKTIALKSPNTDFSGPFSQSDGKLPLIAIVKPDPKRCIAPQRGGTMKAYESGSSTCHMVD